MHDQEVEFIILAARSQPNISIAEIWDTHRHHGGLSEEEAAADVLSVVQRGLIGGSATITDAGTAWLAKRR